MVPEILHLEDLRWRECLERLPHDFYHRPEYVALESQRLEAEARAFHIQNGDERFFVPYLIRPVDSLFPGQSPGKASDIISPYGYPGVMLSDAARLSTTFASQAFGLFGESLRSQGVCSAFLRMHPIIGRNYRELFPAESFTDNGETVAVDLRLEEAALWKQMRENYRTAINKLKRLGYAARWVPLKDHLDDFIQMYEETMDRVQAKENYYFSRDYFAKLAEFPDGVHCCLVELEGKLTSACIFFECQGIVQAHLGGTRNEHLPKSPFHMVLYSAALWAKARGNRYLHLGGGVGGTNDTLLQYKAGFSPLRFPFMTLRMVTDPPKYRALTELRAQACQVPLDSLTLADFFPAYRAER